MSIRLATSVPATMKTWYARATRSRTTIAFFFFVLANYAAQTALHAMYLSLFSRNRGLVTNAIDVVGVQRGFAVVQQGVLEICSGIPAVYGTTCYTVYNGSTASTPPGASSMQCAEGLTWLEIYLLNSKSEETVYLVWGSWLVVISLIALMNESIPHLIVVLVAQIINTSWISYRIASNISAKRIYDETIVDGACGSFDILGGSWQYGMFYAALGFSIVALLAMFLFSFKLVTLYSNAKLTNVGSPPVVGQMLKWRLWMQVFLQLTSFFILASVVVWYDKWKSVTTASYYSVNVLNDVGFYIVTIITWPWLLLGLYSISREERLLFLVYALLSAVLLVISLLWFGSALFRYEYGTWHSFAWVATLADVLLMITCFLSVVCRLNFGKGLAHFLAVEQELQASGFTWDIFRDGSSAHSRSDIRAKRVVTPKRPQRRSQLAALDLSWSSLTRLTHAPSVCSVESAMFASWLSSKGSRGGLDKCSPRTAEEERPASVIIISAQDMNLCAPDTASSISDDGDENGSADGVDEKQTIVS